MAASSSQGRTKEPRLQTTADDPAMESSLRAAVSEQVGEAKFGIWFGEGVQLAIGGEGDSLQVRVPNPFFKEWIRDHFSRDLLKAAEAVTGRRVQLDFAVQDEADPPLGDVVGPGTDTAHPRPGSPLVVPVPGNPKTPLSNPEPTPGNPKISPQRRFHAATARTGGFRLRSYVTA